MCFYLRSRYWFADILSGDVLKLINSVACCQGFLNSRWTKCLWTKWTKCLSTTKISIWKSGISFHPPNSSGFLPDQQNSQIKTLIRSVKCFQHTTNFHSYDPIPLLTFTPTVTILFIYLYLSLDLKITDFQSNVMPVSQDHFYSIHETQDRPTKPYYNNSHHL